MECMAHSCLCLQVFQVRLKHNGKVYAMKVMRKDRIIEKNHGDYIKAERDVLTAVLHPYIVALRYSFQVSFSQAHSSRRMEQVHAGLLHLNDKPAACL